MAKNDDKTNCPYCGTSVEVKAGHLRPHLVEKDGDRCDGSGLQVQQILPSGQPVEKVKEGNDK